MRKILTALAVALSVALACLAPMSTAVAATPAHAGSRTGCSTAYLDGDYRLGPRRTPNRGPIALELAGYRRFAGLTRQRFLNRYWDTAAGSWKYPPDNGFLIVDSKPVEFTLALEPGEPLDRYGSVYGGFLAPAGTPYFERSIPPSNLDDAPGFTCNYHTYTVRKAFKVKAGPAAPSFGQPGLGLQYQLVAALLPGDPTRPNISWLLQHGYLAATN